LNGNWDGAAVSTVIGADFAQWDYARLSNFSGSISEEKGQQTSHAAYLRTDVALSSQWRVNAGVRSEKFSHQIDNLWSGTSLHADPSLSAAELGLSYAFAQSWNAYARMASSYRVANVDELRYLSAVLEPQTARDLELGLRYLAGSTNYGVRLFAQRTRNEIAYDNSAFANINLHPVRRTGLELEGGMQLTKQLKVSTVAQVIRAELVDGVYSGNDLPLAPNSTVLIRAAYDVAPGHAVDASFRSVGSAPFGNDWTNTCPTSIPHANFLDLGYRFKARASAGWSAFIGVDNVLDEQTYSVGYTNSSCSAYNVYPDAGRRLKARASYRF
jgi:iron complex outermembrane receptor protein